MIMPAGASCTPSIVVSDYEVRHVSSGIAALGIRWDVRDPAAFGFLVLKVGFGVVVTVLGSHYLLKHARPGGEMRTWILLAGIPFIAIIALAGVSLVSAAASHWDNMMMGERWLECLLSIPVIAMVPFVVIMWAVRKAAPTNLTRTGALVGLVAGGVSAIAYRYYIATDLLKHDAVACTVRRVPAAEIESAVVEQVRGLLRAPEMIVRTWRTARRAIGEMTEPEVRKALERLDPLWDELFPAEQARIVQLLVERVEVSPDGIDIRLRTEGLANLTTELRAIKPEDRRAA